MSKCPSTSSCPQSRRTGPEERRQHHRRSDDRNHMALCARTMAALIVSTSLVSVGASTTITSVMTSGALNSSRARMDAIRADLNAITTQFNRTPMRYTP